MTNPAPSGLTGSSTHQNVVPSEVGWQFVPQYYTFVNKQPNRLHCFYTKNSTFIHGTEGEDGKPCYGQQEIHNKILSIGFQDCKVFIHSVDAQASANNGIIIQVIGEMSNKGEAWRKFVQTFFLAEQPNGYFVLNDIFRFLKEESVESEEGSDADVESEPASVPAPVEHVTEVAPPSPAPQAAPVELITETPVAPEPVAPATPEQQKPQLNGFHHAEPEAAHEPVEETPESVEEESTPVSEAADEPEPASEPVSSPPSAPSPVLAPAPVAIPAPPQQTQPPAPTQAPPPSAPSAPPAPKTWANLAAANSKKWGAAVAQESRGTSEAVAPIVPVSSAPASGTQTPVTATPRTSQGPPQGRDREQHPAFVAANSVTTPQCFVKGVTDLVSNTQLNQVLTQRFGPVKEVELVRSRACAFLEFNSLEHAKRAIIASLPVSQGGEGGIRIDVGAETGPIRIAVEMRKERGERPPPRPRGGAPTNGETRGAYRGRGGAGRGRGGPHPAGKPVA